MPIAAMIFWLKLILVPSLIGSVSLAGRRWGPIISGWFIAFPLTSGPIVFFLALEQGDAFASRAAQGTMMGLISVAAFCLVYSSLAFRLAWFQCFLASCLTFFASTLVLELISIPPMLVFPVVICVLALVSICLPRRSHLESHFDFSLWDIPLRMVAATILVVLLTESAELLGPRLSGLLTPFPLFTSVLAIFTHRTQGADSVAQLLRGLLVGLFTFAIFFLVVMLTLENSGLITSFAIASLVSISFHGATLVLLRRMNSDDRPLAVRV